jgi:hypothetical protein
VSASHERRALLTTILLATITPAVAPAGEVAPTTTLVAGAWTDSAASAWPTPMPATRGRSAPVRLAGATMSLTGATGGVEGRSGYSGQAMGSVRLALTSRLVAELRARLLTLDRAAEFERRSTRTEARLRLGDGRRGAWIGTAFEHSLSGTRPPIASLLALGAEGRARDIALSASLEQTFEPVTISTVVEVAPAVDTIAAQMTTIFDTRLVSATTARVAGRWEHRRIAVESVAGLTLNRLASPSRWAQSSVSFALKPRLSVYATVGSPAPRWFALQAGTEQRASLGLRLTSWSNPQGLAAATAAGPHLPSWRLRHLADGWQVIEVRVPDALNVEVMGDFTSWSPTALVHVHGDRWAAAVRMEPGVHQAQVRVDGGPWTPPGGLPTLSDGFSGMVGVFVAK